VGVPDRSRPAVVHSFDEGFEAHRPFPCDEHQEDMHKLGEEGWDLAAVTSDLGIPGFLYFKRPKQ
jgi:hypothetical protein